MNLLHHIDAARSLLKMDAEWVFATIIPSSQSVEIEDFASVVVGFGRTVATFVGAASIPEPPGEQLRLWGSAGHCVVFPQWQFASADGADIEVTGRPEPDDPQAAAIDSFVDAARTGRAPDVTVEDALAVQAIVSAAYESARTGRCVRPTTLLSEEAE
jgi:predicted dehydrogenase